MDIERNTDVLHRELSVITRVLTRVAVVLSLACCAVYAVPGEAGDTGREPPGTGWIASTGAPRSARQLPDVPMVVPVVTHELERREQHDDRRQSDQDVDGPGRRAHRAEDRGHEIELEQTH